MKTLVVNTFGGPGSGKTTACWEIASSLKKKGILTEYVSEYAKELVYEERFDILDDSMKNQKEILKEQKRRINRLIGKVEVVVTDSPLLLSIIYANDKTEEFVSHIIDIYCDYDNINLVIRRPKNKEYEQAGRKQNFEESKQKDKEILELLEDTELVYTVYNRGMIKDICNQIETKLKEVNKDG